MRDSKLGDAQVDCIYQVSKSGDMLYLLKGQCNGRYDVESVF